MKTLMSILILASMVFPTTASAQKHKPFNRVVIIIDSSGTFRGHQFEAIEKVKGFLKEMAKRKERRYEGKDQIYIISLDAKPEVVWAGQRGQLMQLTEKRLSELFSNRERYAYCTDVATAFNLAAHKLNREPLPTAKWLFVFSDLIDEPVVSGNKCKTPGKPSLPPEKIRWDILKDVAVMVFWAPDIQIMAWEEALADKGLTIRFYDEAEASNVELLPPPKARKRMTEEERVEARRKIKTFLTYLLTCLKTGVRYFLIGIVFLVIVGGLVGRIRSRATVTKNHGRR